MKKGVVLIITLLMLFINCGNQSSGKGKLAETEKEIKSSDIDSQISSLNKKVVYHGTIEITRKDFLDKVWNYSIDPNNWEYKGELPCIIDFYADWCRPCKMVAPFLEELAKEYAGKVIFYKINTEKEKQIAADFGINSIPTFLYCPMQGNPVMDRGIPRGGSTIKKSFENIINELLLADKTTNQ